MAGRWNRPIYSSDRDHAPPIPRGLKAPRGDTLRTSSRGPLYGPRDR
jgi:hypothetical protein